MYLYNHSGKTNVYEEQQIDVDELDSCDGDIDALIAQEWTAAAGILISLLIDHLLGQKIFGVTVIGKLVFNSKSRGNIPQVCSTKHLCVKNNLSIHVGVIRFKRHRKWWDEEKESSFGHPVPFG